MQIMFLNAAERFRTQDKFLETAVSIFVSLFLIRSCIVAHFIVNVTTYRVFSQKVVSIKLSQELGQSVWKTRKFTLKSTAEIMHLF